ncbi:hypothetical protein JXB02_01535 [Candidatus Woesearchaeota archaeon]|nr:hypothetical protein [Candidatus Woesearchaeota archaeon]
MRCDFCDYTWMTRVKTPKACPRCKRRFDYPAVDILERAIAQMKQAD